MTVTAGGERRRAQVLNHPTLNGIDFAEVADDPAVGPPTATVSSPPRMIQLHFLKPVAAGSIGPAQVVVEGGERIRGLKVTGVVGTADPKVLAVTVDRAGDFSTYVLRLVGSAAHPDDPGLPPHVDRQLARVEVSFRLDCDGGFDCASGCRCRAEALDEPQIDYLARDYASFRRLILDRLSTLMPGWRERNPASVEMVKVELLAYVADHLSYRIDAAATEAYLRTARLRTSVRRHARLVDYPMHDGCNARAWVQLQVSDDLVRGGPSAPTMVPAGTQILTGVPERLLVHAGGAACRIVPGSASHDEALRSGAVIFETLHDVDRLYVAHNRIRFYAWDEERYALPAGATRATLRQPADGALQLARHDVLIFQEVLGPRSGRPEDADPRRRHAVRLTDVTPATDELTGAGIVEIAWRPEDALPFPFCIATQTDSDHGESDVEDVSVALGNVVLADHGRTVHQRRRDPVAPPPGPSVRPPVSPPVGPPLGPVPGPSLWWAPAEDGCDHGPSRPVPPRFRPRLALGPVTQAASVDVTSTDASGQRVVDRAPFDSTGPASAVFRWAMQDVVPSVTLTDSTGATWRPRRDLLASHADDAHFVVEVADDQVAALRFGDFTFGKGADEGMTFDVTYRIGNGTAGNVAAGALANIVTDRPEIVGVSNPLPALGGVDPEAVEDVRVRAPVAFRTQQRAVTPEDYARLAEQFPSPDLPEVQRAVAAFRWTGSWRTVFLTVDRMGGLDVDDEFEERLRRYLERYRMAVHDVEIEGPVYVPLDLALLVCARPDAFRSQVHAALMERFSDRVLPDGRLGVFHPDNLTFGQTVYASPLIAAALDVPGVASVELTRFERWGRPGPEALAAGRLTVGRREIPRLDNDPSFPDRGRLQIHVEGGA